MTVTDEQIDAMLDRPFEFRERRQPTPSDLRPVWRVPVVLLLVDACRQRHATYEQLHVLNWAVRSAASAQALSTFLAGHLAPEEAVVRFEPALDRAVSLARGFGFIEWNARYWELTPRGRSLVAKIRDRSDVLTREKELLGVLPTRLSQAAVNALLRRAG